MHLALLVMFLFPFLCSDEPFSSLLREERKNKKTMAAAEKKQTGEMAGFVFF
jgi:hypothetical protein